MSVYHTPPTNLNDDRLLKDKNRNQYLDHLENSIAELRQGGKNRYVGR